MTKVDWHKMHEAIDALTWNIQANKKQRKNQNKRTKKNDGAPNRPKDDKDFVNDRVVEFQDLGFYLN